jgi:WD40 repeat protein
MSLAAQRIRDVFVAAVKVPPDQWEAFLKEACAGDEELCRQVGDLLQEHQHAGSFLEQPAVPRAATCAFDAAVNGAAIAAPPESPEMNPGSELKLDFLTPSEKPGYLGRLGNYEVTEVIGRGGMGVVLKAFDEKLHRVVAIKVMAPQLATSATARKRFTREAQAAAAIRNEHIVDIHAVEEANGLPFLVMEYVSGMSLQERLDQAGQLEPKEILRIGIQVATGLAAAHTQGLIHRDIKPANILLENGVQRVKITDFGLARAADDASLSQPGVVAGTPQYMAPEQAEGKPVDQRADLFSLGSVLYAVCTGRAPFRASTSMAVLKRVCEDTPRPIREINPEVPDGLVEIIAELHAKDPAERFQSAAQLAELLSQHLAHLQQPALLLAPAPLPRGPRRLRPPLGQHRRWRWAAAVVLLVFGGLGLTEATGVTSLAVTVIRVLTPDGTLVVEVDDPQIKVTIEGDGGLLITGAGPQEVRLKAGSYRVLAAKDGKSVKEELVTISRGGKRVVKVSVESPTPAAQLPRVPLGREIRRFIGHKDTVGAVAFSADGRSALSGSADGTVRLWDLATGKELHRFAGHGGAVDGVSFSPDGRRALSGCTRDGTMRLWEVKSGRELRRFVDRQLAHAVAFSPDGRHALSLDDRMIRLWDLDSGKEVRQFQGHTHYVASAVFSSDGRRILSGAGWDSRVRLWDVQSGQVVARLSGHGDGWVRAVALSPDGRRALTAMLLDHLVRFWDVEGQKELRRFQGHTGWVVAVAFSPDGQHAVTASYDQTARLWDVETGKELCRFEGHTGPVNSVVFSPDGRRVLSGSEDGTVRLWDIPGEAPEQPGRHTATVRCVAYSPDGKLLASGGEDSLVIIRDAETLREHARLRHPSWVWSMAFSPDGRQLVTIADGRIRLWDVPTASESPAFRGHAGSFVSVAYSPDGRRVLSGGNDNDKTMRLWDAKTGEELRRFNGHGRIVWSVAFSPDGRRALSGSADRIVRLWDVETGELLGRLEGHTGWVRSVAFSPDGRRALSSGGGPAEEGHWIDCTVRVWDLETHKELQRFEGHSQPVWSAVFLPDGRRVLSGGDPIARLWDVESGKEMRTFKGHLATINDLALSPDGRRVASASDDRTVRLWELETGKERPDR